MDNSAGLLFCLIIGAFLVYYIVSRGYLTGFTGPQMVGTDVQPIVQENLEMPGRGADVFVPAPAAGPRKVTPSGPNPPAQQAADGEVVITAPPTAIDPYAEQVQAANAEETIRNPERMYRPTVQNTDTMIATVGGVASPVTDTTEGAIQAFNTDFIENRGEFMSGVFANDSAAAEMGFSAF